MKISLLRRNAIMVEYGAFSLLKSKCYNSFKIINLEGHPYYITGSKFTMILLKGWNLPIGGASAVEGLRATGLPLLFFYSLQLELSPKYLQQNKLNRKAKRISKLEC